MERILSEEPRNLSSWAALLVPPYCFFAAMVVAADFTAITLQPLTALQIPYPGLMDYAPLIVPGASAVLWLLTRRKWRMAGPIITVAVCFALVSLIPAYAQSRVAHVAIQRWINPEELKSITDRTGFAVYEYGSGGRRFVVVAPQNEQAVRAELRRLGLLSPGEAGGR